MWWAPGWPSGRTAPRPMAADTSAVLVEVDGAAACLTWMGRVVFDNATARDLLRPFVPADGAAHVLVTSDRPSVADLGGSVAVDVFTAEEARAFLAERTALADDEEAAKVVSELGYMPLALAQAAAGDRRAAAQLRSIPGAVTARLAGGYPAHERGQHYPPGVAAAVLLSLDAARASHQSGISVRLMETIAVLPGAGAHRALLHAAGQAGVWPTTGNVWLRPWWMGRWNTWPAGRCWLSPWTARPSSCTTR